MIAVENVGIGIGPDDQERIFTVFDRLHSRDEYQGRGLGLALCQRIVERHGGDIWVESEPGEGSKVYFTLPTADEVDEQVDLSRRRVGHRSESTAAYSRYSSHATIDAFRVCHGVDG